jgi:cellulose synthase (UDP-forming)
MLSGMDETSGGLPGPEPRALSRARAIACIVAVGIGGGYIIWRFVATLNPAALWFAIPLWVAEAYGLVSSILFYYTSWNTRPQHEWRAARPGLSVDVMVPSYNEPLWVVRRTLLGAIGMTYPHTTYLLDDGRRPAMRELAHELGCGYITRPNNEGAKAGNLNWAMAHTTGDLIAIFDADHVPLPNFLDRMLGYFDDPSIAFVQSPQEYYNIESFQHVAKPGEKRTWHEQQLFYRVIQPGKDHWNAAFFCGSCGVMRRSALADVGGFATETITEDMHTSLRLHARGWSSAYHNEVLALGLAAQTATPYHLQRLRWGQGTLQVLRREKVLRNRGLTIHQRLNYFASALHYFDGYQRLLLYLAPSLAVATGVLPIRALTIPFLASVAVYYAASMLAFKLTGRGYAMFIATERYHMVRFYTYIRASVGLLRRRKLRFSVSPKAQAGAGDVRLALPAIIVGGYVIACFAVGLARLLLGHHGNAGAFWINAAWSGWIFSLAVAALVRTKSTVDFRRLPRAHAGLPVRWETEAGSGIGVLVDLSERGAAVLVPRALRAGETVSFHVLWPGVRLTASGTVRRTRRADNGAVVGLEWQEAGGTDARQLAGLAIDLTSRRFLLDYNRPWGRKAVVPLPRHRRGAPRKQLQLPVRLGTGADDPWAVSEDVSATGALLFSPVAVTPGTRVQLSLSDGRTLDAEIVRCQQVTLPPGIGWRLGVRIDGELVAAASPDTKTPVHAAAA